MNELGRRVAVVGSSAAIGLGIYLAPKLHDEPVDRQQAPQAQAANQAETASANKLTDEERAIFAGLIAIVAAAGGLALTGNGEMRGPSTRNY